MQRGDGGLERGDRDAHRREQPEEDVVGLGARVARVADGLLERVEGGGQLATLNAASASRPSASVFASLRSTSVRTKRRLSSGCDLAVAR